MSQFAKRFTSLICMIALVVIVGTTGYALLEGWDLIDGFYMTLITISTVGYGEVRELTPGGRVFTCVLILLSMVSLVYWTAGFTSILVSHDLKGDIKRKRELKMISKMRNHVVVCGGGIMARTVITGLLRQRKEVVAIIEQESQVHSIKRLFPDLMVIQADPKSDLSLADANVLQAQFLVAALESDYDNLLITITGNNLGADLQVLSCAMDNEVAAKMLKVGATEVICPMVLCGEHVTSLICSNDVATSELALC